METRILSLKLRALILGILLFLNTTYIGFYKPLPVNAVDPVTITLTIEEFIAVAWELGFPISDPNALIWYFGTNGVNVTIPAGGTIQEGVAEILAEVELAPEASQAGGAMRYVKGGLFVIALIELALLLWYTGKYIEYSADYNEAVAVFDSLPTPYNPWDELTPSIDPKILERMRLEASIRNALEAAGYKTHCPAIVSLEYCASACQIRANGTWYEKIFAEANLLVDICCGCPDD